MQSLNQVLKQIRTAAGKHTQINTYAEGQAYDFSASDALLYPCLWAVPQGISPGLSGQANRILGTTVDYRIQLFMMDKENADGTNEIDILSDTAQILFDVISYLDNEFNDSNELSLTGIGNLEPFVDARLDMVAGYSCELVFTVFYDHSVCTDIMN